ncbi:preprotein translocase subunit SecG [Echinimonas agarilytica]|uniref:Protein-export membrane protein SecG n=1 Tax=Echinimonas agarilytica TaxID=1215918 RepID=A0AA41W6R6_9GAMM|nr:preprotein translocase subunit SecG [Echinimonas agarilytica]MCM2679671.1 preprotein translocase subunit SecG [Echinimonas agarilytica]
MYELIIIVYLLVALAIIGLVLIQQGKGADMGASFGAGGGASASLFGSSGSGNFLTRTTALLATVFFVLSLVIGNLTNERVKQSQEWENLADDAVTIVEEQEVPATAPESDIPN